MNPTRFDLENRLLEFSVRIIRVVEVLPRTTAGRHIADQLLRSGTSPYANHGEAEGAESRDDFVHKLKVCYKELRETRRWLRLIKRVPMIEMPTQLDELLDEVDQLVRIFFGSLRTTENNRHRDRKPDGG
jgi:four helix bundle protein